MTTLEITITHFTHDPAESFRKLIQQFETEEEIRVSEKIHAWGSTWSELMKILLYRQGPVISQVGSTWMSSLEATDGLRVIRDAEVGQIGGAASFHAEAWRGTQAAQSQQVLGIPWFLDAYMLYYRQDLLEKAGIDDSGAFSSLEALTETVAKLHKAGFEIPFAYSQAQSRAAFHNLTQWVWTYGGDLVAEDGRTLLLSDKKTREAMKAYYSMYRHTPPGAQLFEDDQCYQRFLDGTAVISLRNTSMLHSTLKTEKFLPHLPNLKVAPMPGVNFVGGSNLVVWKHIPVNQEKLAIQFLAYLSRPETQFQHLLDTGILPANLAALERAKQETAYAPIVDAIKNGRSFRKFRLWSLLEDKLSAAVNRIWQVIYAEEEPNLDKIISNELEPLERRLQITLSNA